MIDKKLIHQAAEDIDIFEEDLTAEYERLCSPRPRILRLWPLAAAACVAGIIAIFLTPPKATKEVSPLFTTKESLFKKQQMWQYEDRQSALDIQLAYQREIKRKGERLAAYIQEQQELINEPY
ncbi:MAG: hypothetical protein K6G70_01630 [Bacteroidaceae bacterium]|nr:hypothetical protein [Bacteroidaceae bacterium]